jgi:hypothetical protein
MSLADDLPPEACLEACTETIEGNLVAISKNLPDVDDSQEDLARKYTILGKCLRSIKEYTKEALKAAQIGSDSCAYNLMEAGKHRSLQDFSEEEKSTQVTITGPDGKSFQTDMGCLDRAAKLAEDPAAIRKILNEGE